MKYFLSDNCPVKKSLELIGGKWKLLIVYQFLENPIIRYGKLKASIPNISEKMLIQELKILVKNEILLKKSYPEIPPKVEYILTDKGRELFPIIKLMEAFGMSYFE